MTEKILIIDFGSQYTQLIARRIRELNIYSEIHPYNDVPPIDSSVKGIVFSGSPYSVVKQDALLPDSSIFKVSIPILGICYGAQLIAHVNGGKLISSTIREYGRAKLSINNVNSVLFKNISNNSQVWMSHGDTIDQLPEHYQIAASTNDVRIAGFNHEKQPIYGIQFHPEVYHTTEGLKILSNFVVDICNCSQNWTPDSFINESIRNIKEIVKNDKVILGLSGGVDSSVAALLINKAIGKNLFCIFIDNGLLRKDEYETVLQSYQNLGLNIQGINAKEQFIGELSKTTDPEEKRKIIGRVFIEVFESACSKNPEIKWLAQGTIYPDVIESKSVKGPSATIKSHHNVGGLPDRMKLQILEPLNKLFKDEVRKVGNAIHLPINILNRHPFPGPGLAIRIIGNVTHEKIAILQEVDSIFIEGLKNNNLYDKVWQAGAILLPIQSVGVMGDERTYENVVCLRAVNSTDGMTADWSHLPYDFLANISNEIINKVKGINRVVYDISSKPPATIEWE